MKEKEKEHKESILILTNDLVDQKIDNTILNKYNYKDLESEYDSNSESDEFEFKDDGMNFDDSDNSNSPDPIREIRDDIAWIDNEF